MSVTIETLVFCDDCGDHNGGDDRVYSAEQIRFMRAKWGWVRRGRNDYCDKCAAKHPENGKNQ